MGAAARLKVGSFRVGSWGPRSRAPAGIGDAGISDTVLTRDVDGITGAQPVKPLRLPLARRQPFAIPGPSSQQQHETVYRSGAAVHHTLVSAGTGSPVWRDHWCN